MNTAKTQTVLSLTARTFQIYVKNMHVPQHLPYSARHAELRTLFRLMCAANREGRI